MFDFLKKKEKPVPVPVNPRPPAPHPSKKNITDLFSEEWVVLERWSVSPYGSCGATITHIPTKTKIEYNFITRSLLVTITDEISKEYFFASGVDALYCNTIGRPDVINLIATKLTEKLCLETKNV